MNEVVDIVAKPMDRAAVDRHLYRRDAPRPAAKFASRLAAPSGLHPPPLSARREFLSPLLACLDDDEDLALTVDVCGERCSPVVTLGGTVRANDTRAADERARDFSRALTALLTSQLPEYCFDALTGREAEPACLAFATTLKARGRPLVDPSAHSVRPRPISVGSPPKAHRLLLPQTRFSAQGLLTAVELLEAMTTRAVLVLNLRAHRFSAGELRLLGEQRELVGAGAPKSEVEAIRMLTRAVPDDALMSALISDGMGVALTLEVRSDSGLGEDGGQLICQTVFGDGSSDAHPEADLDLATTYPRHFALAAIVEGVGQIAGRRARPPLLTGGATTEGVLLGRAMDGDAVCLGEADRAMHQFIIGATGTGKSTLMLNQLAADIAAGHGVMVVDSHGDLWEAARRLVPAHRASDVVLAHLAEPDFAFTLNALAGHGGEMSLERSASVNGLIRLFRNSLWPGVPEAFGPIFELYFRNALLLLMEGEGDNATLLGFERIFQEPDYREELIERCGKGRVRDFWRKTAERVTYNEISIDNVAPYIISKLSPFTTNAAIARILDSPRSSLDLGAAIHEGKVVLVNLAKGSVGASAAHLVGALLTMQLVGSAQAQMRLAEAERKQFTVYLDEFQTYATEHIGEAIEEMRKFKLRLVLACQSLGQIDGRGPRPDVVRSVLANVANLTAFRLGVDDAVVLAKYFEPWVSREELMYLRNHQAVARLLIDGQAQHPRLFCTVPPPEMG